METNLEMAMQENILIPARIFQFNFMYIESWPNSFKDPFLSCIRLFQNKL